MGQVPVRRGPTGFSSWRAIVVPANFLVLEDPRVFERKGLGRDSDEQGGFAANGEGSRRVRARWVFGGHHVIETAQFEATAQAYCTLQVLRSDGHSLTGNDDYCMGHV